MVQLPSSPLALKQEEEQEGVEAEVCVVWHHRHVKSVYTRACANIKQ
jgi:hypothetical protein